MTADTPADDQQHTVCILEYYGGLNHRQAQVSDIFICCQARVQDLDLIPCTVTAGTDSQADDQQDTLMINKTQSVIQS